MTYHQYPSPDDVANVEPQHDNDLDALSSLLRGPIINPLGSMIKPTKGSCCDESGFASDGTSSFGWYDFPAVHEYNDNIDIESCSSTDNLSESERSLFSTDSSNNFDIKIPTLSRKSHNPWSCDATNGDLSGVTTKAYDNFRDHKSIDDVCSKEPTRSSSLPTLSSNSPRSSCCTSKVKKSVSFSKLLEVRTHEVIIGDHPCCKDGLPVGLGWDHSETEFIDIDSYNERSIRKQEEQNDFIYHGGLRFVPRRRLRHELRLNSWDRINLLKQTTGLTEIQLLERQRENLYLRSGKQQHQPEMSASSMLITNQTFGHQGWTSASSRLSTIFL